MKIKQLILAILLIFLSINVPKIEAVEKNQFSNIIEIPAALIENSNILELDYDRTHKKINKCRLYIKKNDNGNYDVYSNKKNEDIRNTFSQILVDASIYLRNKIQNQGIYLDISIVQYEENKINMNIITDPMTVYYGLMDYYNYAYATAEILLFLKNPEKQKSYVANIYDYRTGKLIWHKDIYKENLVGDYNRNNPISLDKFYNELESQCR